MKWKITLEVQRWGHTEYWWRQTASQPSVIPETASAPESLSGIQSKLSYVLDPGSRPQMHSGLAGMTQKIRLSRHKDLLQLNSV